MTYAQRKLELEAQKKGTEERIKQLEASRTAHYARRAEAERLGRADQREIDSEKQRLMSILGELATIGSSLPADPPPPPQPVAAQVLPQQPIRMSDFDGPPQPPVAARTRKKGRK